MYFCVLLFVFVYFCVLLFVFVYFCVLLFVFVYFCVLLFVFVYFCALLFVFVYFLFWPLHCLPFFNIWLLITPLISSHVSYISFLGSHENISIYKELEIHLMFRGLWCLTPLSIIVQLYRGGHFYWCKKPQTYHKQLTNFITKCCIEYTPPWAGLELTTLVISHV